MSQKRKIRRALGKATLGNLAYQMGTMLVQLQYLREREFLRSVTGNAKVQTMPVEDLRELGREFGDHEDLLEPIVQSLPEGDKQDAVLEGIEDRIRIKDKLRQAKEAEFNGQESPSELGVAPLATDEEFIDAAMGEVPVL